MKDVVELRTERRELLKQAKLLHARGRLSAADQAKFDNLLKRANALKEQIATEEYGAAASVLGGGFMEQDPDPLEFRNMPTRQHRFQNRKEAEHHQAFMSYLRWGIVNMPQDQRNLLEKEYRDMGVGVGGGAFPGSTSGFFVPVGFVNRVEEAMKYYGPMLDPDVSQFMDTATGNPLPYPTDNDTQIMGERVAEGQQVTEQDVSLSQIMFFAWKYSSKMVKVSLELLQDSAFNMEEWLIKVLAIRLGRILVSDFTNGLGSSAQQPYGLVAATVANGPLITAVGSSTNDGSSAGGNTIGSDDLTNLIHAIDPLYRPNASFMLNDLTLQAILKVKDKYGRPLLDPNLQEPAYTFMGYKLRINNFMSTLQTQASSPPVTVNSVIFGDLKRFLVRRARDMSLLVLRERYADYGQTGFLSFVRYDGQPLFGGTGTAFPFACLQNIY